MALEAAEKIKQRGVLHREQNRECEQSGNEFPSKYKKWAIIANT